MFEPIPRLLCSFSAAVLIGALPLCSAQEPAAAAAQEVASDAAEKDADVLAIEAKIASYTKAFNAHDADAVVQHFSSDGELTTANGRTIKGREALLQDMKAYFESEPDARLELTDVSVNVIAPSVAIESGTAVITAGEESEIATYRAVHIKGANGWMLNRVQDDPAVDLPPSNYEKLQPLEAMVGSWELDSDESSLALNCRWTTNRNFLVVSYSVVDDAGVDFEGTQIIGWDPSKEVIRSWMFDSDGGFGSGAWTLSGDTWTVKTINVVPDGSKASSTNLYRFVDNDTIEYRSIGRQVGGKLLANVPAASFRRAE